MKRLLKILEKPEKTIIGLMSGTSADGLDVVLVKVRGHGPGAAIEQHYFASYAYPVAVRDHLLHVASDGSIDDAARLNILLGQVFADCVGRFLKSQGMRHSDVDLIGSHGHTIRHLPGRVSLFGRNIRATMQVGDPSAIAKLTGIITIGDFRTGDMAVGGQGAPLVPYFDYLMFSGDASTAAVNIGGIANVTLLVAGGTPREIVAFDTGPGNMLIDGAVRKFFNQSFDKDGEIARQGKVIRKLLEGLMMQAYLVKSPPKSTGREQFGEAFAGEVVDAFAGDAKPEDLVATFTEFTACSIYDQITRFGPEKKPPQELILSGGGAKNVFLVERLQEYFRDTLFRPISDFGISEASKEAVCFAVLANEALNGHPANVPSATGADHPVILGKLCL